MNQKQCPSLNPDLPQFPCDHAPKQCKSKRNVQLTK